MKEKIIRVLCGCLVAVGFLIVLGTAGASDCGNISCAKIFGQCAVGLLLMFAGCGIGIVKGV